ncbi:hypothetical protein RJ639_001055 [Escallonia herrerae]|uniref:Uncharacterized protein n=1 Tax=Escallonia herrerae TaxID=1293975 RepID=A0AA89BN49_9ASTE|nr:hypothetical protein RJ639_001055 [Escallonia herrerae]
MAASSQTRGIAILGQRFVGQIRGGAAPVAALSQRRSVHVSVYDKNPDEHVRPAVVPDELVEPKSDKYWAPHPQTGVFGPASEDNQAMGGECAFHTSASPAEDSVLEQKAFFRPLEDLEKPQPPHN